MERVHLEFTGNASRYIHTHYAYAITFIIYSIQVSSLHDHKVWNNEKKKKKKRKGGGKYKTVAIKR